MAYSMILVGILTEYTGEEILSQCLVMGPYLLSLGLSSAFGDRILPHERLRAVWNFEWLSVIVLPLVPLALTLSIFIYTNLADTDAGLSTLSGNRVLFVISGGFAFITGLFGGAQLPLILKDLGEASEEKILSLNYLGPLLASVSIVQMNTHAFSLALQIYIIGIIQLFGLLLLLLVSNRPKKVQALTLLFIPLLLLFFTGFILPRLEHLTIKSAYLKTRTSISQLLRPTHLLNLLGRYGSVERVRTPYQTIDLFIEPPAPEYSAPGNASVYLNRKPQFDLFSVAVYHESMVFGGINLLQRKPDSVLILGAGDGLLLKELKRIEGIQKITMIELDPQMLQWSATNPVVSGLNEGSLSNLAPNVDLKIGDAITFLRSNSKKYDLVFVDFPFPDGHDLSKLYSHEFYRLLRQAIGADSVVLIDLPLYIDKKGKLSMESQVILKTMKHAGLGDPLLFGPSASFVALRGTGAKPQFEYDQFPESLKLATYLNFASPFREDEVNESEWAEIPVNSMFWPRGL